MDPRQHLSEKECWSLFQQLFPQGLQDPDLVQALAPAGWEHSPYCCIAHPTPQQQRANEYALAGVAHSVGLGGEADEPWYQTDDLEAHQPIGPTGECGGLVAACLWDIFSHVVLAPDGRLVSLDVFGSTEDFIGQFYDNPRGPSELAMDDCRFCAGTVWIRSRVELAPVYTLLFGRLRKCGLDWRYVDPFGCASSDRRDVTLTSLLSVMIGRYDAAGPGTASIEPPSMVLAYQAVYGQWPNGWLTSSG